MAHAIYKRQVHTTADTASIDGRIFISISDAMRDKISQAVAFAARSGASEVRFECDCDWPESDDDFATLQQAIMSELAVQFGPGGDCIGVRATCEDRYTDAHVFSDIIRLDEIFVSEAA